jgi:hypothetical protein
MARFYFHLQDADELHTDPEGTDLPDVDAAKREALLAARDILSDAIKTGKSKVPEAFVIADEAGRKVAVVCGATTAVETSMRYRSIDFEVEEVSPDKWRWKIHASEIGPAVTGKPVHASREAAIGGCVDKIDRENPAP